MWVKICCIQSIEEARLAISCGAQAIGLVAAMPSGPGPIDDATIAEIAAWARREAPAIESFLLTARTEADAIIEHARACGPTTLQLVDAIESDCYGALRRALPEIGLVQVLHVEDESAIELARRVAPHVDRILLDSGRPQAARPELGGTGRTHDWGISRKLVESVAVPVILAGGLRAENAREAIHAVRPSGLDLCSGVRTEGRLDESKVRAFMVAVRNAEVG